ncbi:D-amino-acid:oxygen oxidoreductase (deaminating) [Geodermatophilus tzadiensis]|uniref:D-amino-acid oxidase n=1 Tax=Geodermatophilus tzadiensis TaxID=1137988 RepID=A0A2T0TNZ9_9ACTN|nr:FAD-dependent oxidoreductase [Geodermatophilus tzadiensis]PRY47395.1 D-amino-acid:oxygen oxidoreductase (deaminating) [Geodermatophilus tzadiensis]
MRDDGGPGLRVAVVGGGVVGLTCALELARAGHRVQVHAADPPEATTSAVAAAIWFPYRAAPVDAVLRWGLVSRTVFTALADDPATGVTLRPGTVVHRNGEPDLWWTAGLAHRPATAAELPPGVPGGTRCTVPVVDTVRYLPWLAGAVRSAGVEVVRRRVDRLDDVPGDVVVVAAGLASGPLLGDDSGVPVQGQVVRLADPGLTDWLLDEDGPDGLTYVIPRGHDVVCGGTAVEGATGTEPDPDVEAAVLARARALVPALREAPVLSRQVGLRPGRPTVRLERVAEAGRPAVACYGHGGAGVTLSWGCAADVVALV